MGTGRRPLSYEFLEEPKKFNATLEPLKKEERLKVIRIWLNKQSKCYKICINPHELDDWDAILEFITICTKPEFGPIVRLIALSTLATPISYHELDPTEKYIALGPVCKLKNDPELYSSKTAIWTEEDGERLIPSLKVTKNMHISKLIGIYVACNGKRNPPYKIFLRDTDLKYSKWPFIRSYVSSTLGVQAIRSIFTPDGVEVFSPEDFCNEGFYVAVPIRETFRVINYQNVFSGIVKKNNPANTASENTGNVKEVPKEEKKKKQLPNKKNKKSEEKEDKHKCTSSSTLFSMDSAERYRANSRPFYGWCRRKQADRIQSIFKLIRTYEAKIQKYKFNNGDENPETDSELSEDEEDFN